MNELIHLFITVWYLWYSLGSVGLKPRNISQELSEVSESLIYAVALQMSQQFINALFSQMWMSISMEYMRDH